MSGIAVDSIHKYYKNKKNVELYLYFGWQGLAKPYMAVICKTLGLSVSYQCSTGTLTYIQSRCQEALSNLHTDPETGSHSLLALLPTTLRHCEEIHNEVGTLCACVHVCDNVRSCLCLFCIIAHTHVSGIFACFQLLSACCQRDRPWIEEENGWMDVLTLITTFLLGRNQTALGNIWREFGLLGVPDERGLPNWTTDHVPIKFRQ